MLDWMAWTIPTALVFVFVFGCIGLLAFLEVRTPGGDPRHGILGIETTRGDRLFISILGTVFIMLAWLGLYGTPLWGGLCIAIVWWVFVWKKV
jgi:predicted small integral membrane protein